MKSVCATLLMLSALTSLSALAEQSVELSPDKSWKVITQCKNTFWTDCTVRVQNLKTNETQWVVKDPYPKSPGIRWLSADLLQVVLSCGSPCNGSLFFSPTNGVSTLYPSVVAVNVSKKVLAFADSERVKPAVVVLPIFGKQKSLAVAELNFSPVAALVSAIREATFLASGDLDIRYVSGSNFSDAHEIIKIQY